MVTISNYEFKLYNYKYPKSTFEILVPPFTQLYENFQIFNIIIAIMKNYIDMEF